MSSTFRHPSFWAAPNFILIPILYTIRSLGLVKQFFSVLPYAVEYIHSTAFGSYQPDEHDVIVATFSKSGTNWMLQIVLQIIFLGNHHESPTFSTNNDNEINNKTTKTTTQKQYCHYPHNHIHDIVPWPEAPLSNVIPLSKIITTTTSHSSSSSSSALSLSYYFLNAPCGKLLRPIKTAIEPNHIPYNSKAIYISVIRDPKEVFVSTFNFMPFVFQMHHQFSKQDFYELLVTPARTNSNGQQQQQQQQGGGAYAKKLARHLAQVWDKRNLPNWHVVCYKHLKQDPVGEISKIATFLNVDVTTEQLELILHKTSFDYMKEREEYFGPPILPFLSKKINQSGNSGTTTGNENNNAPLMMRSGATGNSRELFTSKQRDRIDEIMKFELSQLNSDFPYDQYFS